MAFDRERYRQRMKNDTGEGSGLSYYGHVFDVAGLSAAVKKWFSPKVYLKTKKTNLIDVLPWKITQPWYREVLGQNRIPVGAGPGDYDYKLELPMHRDIGPGRVKVICPLAFIGRPCIICEEKFDHYKSKTEEGKSKGKALQEQWRDFYNIYDYDADADGYQCWDVSYHLFEKFVKESATVNPRGFDFWFPEGGMSVEFKGREKDYSGKPYTECYDINFVDRQPYTEDVVEQTVSFDQFVKILSSSELERLHLGYSDGEEEPSSPPPPTRGRERLPEVRGRERETPRDEPPPERSRERSRERPAADEIPPGRSEPARGRQREPEPAADPNNPCPAGKVFGRVNDYQECRTCPDDVYESCANEGEKKTQSPPPEEPPRRRRG